MSSSNAYQGFIKSKNILENQCLNGYKAFSMPSLVDTKIRLPKVLPKRLGKFCEILFTHAMANAIDWEIGVQSLQIIDNKITLGEIDYLLSNQHGELIHVELAYKLYLYTGKHQGKEIWLGPNAKDRLDLKVKRLVDQQLPLLNHPACSEKLNDLGINPALIKSQFYMPGQLFVHPNEETEGWEKVNEKAINGHWIYLHEFEAKEGEKYFIPEKNDWLLICHSDVDWKSHEDTIALIKSFHTRKFSPLIWVNSKSGNLRKQFVVWWTAEKLKAVYENL